MTAFDSVLMVDWSGGNDRGPAPKADAIWACTARGGVAEAPVYLRNRHVAEAWIAEVIEAELTAGRRLLAGFDFPFGYPSGFTGALCGSRDPLVLWDWLEARIEDAPKANNRFDVAGEINAGFMAPGPFWGNGLRRDVPGLPRKKPVHGLHGFAEKRRTENAAPGAFTLWQLAGAGSVGSQTLMGLPVLARLRRRFPGRIAAWPFEALDRDVALVEVWPSLFAGPAPAGMIRDAHQVACVASVLAGLAPSALARMLAEGDREEGWILGLGHEALLRGGDRNAA